MRFLRIFSCLIICILYLQLMHSNIIVEKVKRDYDMIADDFSGTRNYSWGEFKIFDKFLKRDFAILDLGCGNGRLLNYLKQSGCADYLGVDQSMALIAIAKSKFPENKFIADDFTKKLPLRRKFDAVFFVASYHHIPPDLQLPALKYAASYLKKGGYVFMINWNLRQMRFWFKSRLGHRGLLIPWKNSVKRYYYSFTKGILASLFRAAGLKVLMNEYYSGARKSNMFSAKNLVTIAINEKD